MSPRGRAAGVGRQKGTPNKATAEIREAAQAYTQEALETLADVMRNSKSDAARALAAEKILDRGYGRPTQALEHTGADGGPIQSASAAPLDLDLLTDEELHVLQKAMVRVQEQAAA